MKTWEAANLTIFLAPQGLFYNSGLIKFSKVSQKKEGNFFDEKFHKDRVKSARVSPKILKRMSEFIEVKLDNKLDIRLTNDENWKVIGSVSFQHQAFILEFDSGREKRKFFCVEGLFYIKQEEPEFQHPVNYFHMIGVLLPEGGKFPDKFTISGMHIPAGWITNVEIGPHIKTWNKPQNIPTHFCYPDFPFPSNGWPLEKLKTILRELPNAVNVVWTK